MGDSFFSDYLSPQVQQWNMTLQHSLPGNLVTEVGYIGNHTLHLVDGETGKQSTSSRPLICPWGPSCKRRCRTRFYGKIPYTDR